ncbi:HNH endonuclease [Shewanella sp. WXL01]|nr:HNH endonuclease [Shewanella sp. WXL01]
MPTTPATAQQQVDFIAYLQRLLVEGEFVATYKFALLHAIADICIERPITAELAAHLQQNPSSELDPNIITIDALVEKFIELYWYHSLPYGVEDSQAIILLQNTGKQSALIRNLSEFRAQGVRSFTQLKMHPKWKTLKSKTRATFKEGPLWRLQILSGQEECFYYAHDKKLKHIRLNSGIAYCFRRFYDLVVSLARTHWVQKVCDIPANQSVIGGLGNVSDFLFGRDRQTITAARPILTEIQHGNCFYCGKPLKENGEVDHFIPWARYPNDLAHNFVLAHSSCNNAKKDYLAAEQHKDRWFEQNIIQHKHIIDAEMSKYFVCESERSEAITTWAYQMAANSNSSLWLHGKQFESHGNSGLLLS